MLHGTDDLRMLLARAYFHSAQFGRAEATLTQLIEESPTDGYAHLLLGRTLQRAGRHAEAARPLALAEILGDYERPQAYGATPSRPTTSTRGHWSGRDAPDHGRRLDRDGARRLEWVSAWHDGGAGADGSRPSA